MFVATARCLETEMGALTKQIESIRASTDSPERQARQIARRERQLAEARRMLAQSTFNTAVAYYNLSRHADARPFAEKVVDDEQLANAPARSFPG